MRLTTATNAESDATNNEAAHTKEVRDVGVDSGESAARGAGSEDTRPAEVDRTRNRRSREAYNAYQREYMRKRRANPGPN
jgi:hypothetical protein